MSFSSLGLSENISNTLQSIGLTTPTKVQKQVIPAVLQGNDIIVIAQTGSGKTAGFALPILEYLFSKNKENKYSEGQVFSLILTPTRELANQIHNNIKIYAKNLPLKSTCIFGGVSINPQIQALSKGVDILIACPGRLLDLYTKKKIDLSILKFLVCDEADRMFNMGFINDVKKIISHLPLKRQNIFCSATISKDIINISNKFLNNPKLIEINQSNNTIKQHVFRLSVWQKKALLAHLVNVEKWEQVLVFIRTKEGANRLVDYLNKNGFSATSIHGNKSQNARIKALEDFQSNNIRILVATDIAARGLDINNLPHVVNYDLPHLEEDYIHRIGRTGRAGRVGQAISLVSPNEEKLLKAIEKNINKRIPNGDFKGFNPINQYNDDNFGNRKDYISPYKKEIQQYNKYKKYYKKNENYNSYYSSNSHAIEYYNNKQNKKPLVINKRDLLRKKYDFFYKKTAAEKVDILMPPSTN